MGSGIDTRLVCGFLNAGKTTYIQDCIFNDFFHRYGSVLILCSHPASRCCNLHSPSATFCSDLDACLIDTEFHLRCRHACR